MQRIKPCYRHDRHLLMKKEHLPWSRFVNFKNHRLFSYQTHATGLGKFSARHLNSKTADVRSLLMKMTLQK